MRLSGTNIARRLSYIGNHILAAICLVSRKNSSWSQGMIAIKLQLQNPVTCAHEHKRRHSGGITISIVSE
jgi:hypothetical protein